MNIRENVKISTLTTMRIGGNARYVIEINSLEDIKEAYDFAKQHQLPTFILGLGANTLGKDEGFDGIILLNRLKGTEIIEKTPETLKIKAMSGEIWDDFVETAITDGYTGIEALSAIPSTVGAAPVQNIGAYGQSASDTITSVEAYDTKTANIVTFTPEECHFSYRHSIFNHEAKGRFFIISVTFRLNRGEMKPPFYHSVEKYIENHQITDFSPQNMRKIITTIRADKLPDPAVIPSAGSFFKNIYLSDQEADLAEVKNIPVYRSKNENKINSGWLIEQCGLKGKILHNFKISEKAALVLINTGSDKFSDLAAARKEIIAAVREKFGYTLEQEPEELPDD